MRTRHRAADGYLGGMRTALALVACLVAAPASAEPGTIPKAMQGVWTETALDCEAVKANRMSEVKDRSWVDLSGSGVRGTINGRLLTVRTPISIATTGSPYSDVPMVYELRGAILAETIGDARGATLYLRCR